MNSQRKITRILLCTFLTVLAGIGICICFVFARGTFRSGEIKLLAHPPETMGLSVDDVRLKGKSISFNISVPGESESEYLLTEIYYPAYRIADNVLYIEGFVHDVPSGQIWENFPTEWYAVISRDHQEHVDIPIMAKLTVNGGIDLEIPFEENTAEYAIKDIFFRIKYGLRFLRSRSKIDEYFYDFEDEYNRDVNLRLVNKIVIKIGYIKDADMLLFGERQLRSLHAQRERFHYILDNQIIATWMYGIE